MGAYLNFVGGEGEEDAKTDWLEQHGRVVDTPCVFPKGDPRITVVRIWNPEFSALGVVFDEIEFRGFTYPDPRRKIFYVVPREIVKPLVAPAYRDMI